jgi:uncharacterized protein (DUF302 family)
MPDDVRPEIVTKHSSRSVGDLTARLTQLITSKGMKVFDVIDQREEARLVGLDLRETILVIFGSPASGTPVMDAAPLAALDLPLKILILGRRHAHEPLVLRAARDRRAPRPRTRAGGKVEWHRRPHGRGRGRVNRS